MRLCKRRSIITVRPRVAMGTSARVTIHGVPTRGPVMTWQTVAFIDI